MNDVALHESTANASVVAAEQIALRYFFVLSNRWNGADTGTLASSIGLDHIHQEIERSPTAAKYVDPLASFYADVTIPFTTRRQLPIAALTELAVGGYAGVQIEIGSIETAWEGHVATVSPATIRASFRDSITFFDSGHIVYAPAFALRFPWASSDASASSHDTSAQHVSALTSLVSSPGVSYHRGLDAIRSQVLFKFEGEASGQDLLTFINRRLAYLCDERKKSNVFADLINPALKAARSKRGKQHTGVSSASWEDLRSASVEIVGATRHHDIAAWCRRAATEGEATVGVGARAIAALGQNVLDVHNQDEHEILDSLSQATVSKEHVLLIHPKLSVLYSRKSRSFAEMCHVIGGCPYVMLTNVTLAYNEYLLDQSAGLIDGIKRASRNSRWVLGISKTKGLREDLEAREKLFVNQTLNLLPNIFRYPAEREMFEKVEKQRGLEQRAAGFERFARNLYELRQSDSELAEREGTRHINRWLLALGILQVSGLFLAALALDEFRNLDLSRAALWGGFGLFSAAGLVAAATALWQR